MIKFQIHLSFWSKCAKSFGSGVKTTKFWIGHAKTIKFRIGCEND